MTQKELKKLLGAEYDKAIADTLAKLKPPITKKELIAALLKANKIYWVARLSRIDEFFTQNAENMAAALSVPYIAAKATFADRVRSIYSNFESAFNLSQKDARELMNKVVYDRSIADNLRTIAEGLPEGEEKDRILAEISAPAYRYRLQRAEVMTQQAKEVCDQIAAKEAADVREFLQTETERAYNITVEGLTESTPADAIINGITPAPVVNQPALGSNEMPKAAEPIKEFTPTPVETGVYDSFNLISKENVREIVNKNWSGKDFSSTIWGHTDDLAKEIKQVLIEGELSGASEVDMAAKIAERFDVAMHRARCVVRTESNFCTNQAALKGFKSAGVEYYEYGALIDDRTSDICKELDNKIFKVSEAVVGVNYPPMHPYCRSSVLPVLETEDDLDRELEEMMRQAGAPAGMSLDEFVEHLIPSEDGERLVFDPNGKYVDDFKPITSVKTESKAEHNEGNTAEPVDNSEKSGIIKFNNITSIKYKPVSYDDINRVPPMNIFEDNERNLAHEQASRDLLQEVQNRQNYPDENGDLLKPGTEISIVYSEDMRQDAGYVVGEEDKVDIDDFSVPYHAFHTHPDDMMFSLPDLQGIADRDNMLSLTAQGERGSKYVVVKSSNYDKIGYRDYLNERSKDVIYQSEDTMFSLGFIFDDKDNYTVAYNALSDIQQQELRAAVYNKMNEILTGGENYGARYQHQETGMVYR